MDVAPAEYAARYAASATVAGLLTPVSHAGRFNTISCAVGFHVGEGRWLRNDRYMDDYTRSQYAHGRPYIGEYLDEVTGDWISGGDWAFVKEHNVPGLVRGWVALSYAAGHCFMVPHRQWCYTPERGTHWYQGPLVRRFDPV